MPAKHSLCLIALATVLASTTAHAVSTIYTVTGTGTFVAGAACTGNSTTDVDCTLDAAINAAAAGDIIHFAPAIQGGTIVAAIGLPNLTKDITIDASPNGIAIDGGGTAIVFYIDTGPSVTLRRLTIQNAYATNAGALYNSNGNVTIDSCTFTGNHDVSGPGGAITHSFGSLLVLDSTFVGNQAYGGGAIYAAANTVIANSTFTGNSAASGGAITALGTIAILSSIVAGNTATNNTPDISNHYGTTTSLGYNLIGNTSDTNWDGQPSDQIGVDPLFDPSLLAENGGPSKTVALQPGSPARSGGDCSGNATTSPAIPASVYDQRGFVRSTPCTIGAFDMTSIFYGTFDAQ